MSTGQRGQDAWRVVVEGSSLFSHHLGLKTGENFPADCPHRSNFHLRLFNVRNQRRTADDQVSPNTTSHHVYLVTETRNV